MKVCCVSDLHGNLPKMPECDLLLIAGDIVPLEVQTNMPKSVRWLERFFRPWLEQFHRRTQVIGVAGNHDFIFQNSPRSLPPLPWVYLQDSGYQYNNLNVWGTPWQPRYRDFAFNADEIDLKDRWETIPDNTDILLLHGPPYGYGDWSIYDHIHTGSPSLITRINQLKPRLVVAGHIHSGYGTYTLDYGGDFVNAALLDEDYRLTNEPIVIELYHDN